jgi:hypothetical protein
VSIVNTSWESKNLDVGKSEQGRQDAEVGQSYDEGNLENKDHGDTDHEGDVLGLVADDLHGDVHGQGTAHGGPDEQGFFGDAELDVIPLGNLLIVDANDDGDQGNYGNVAEQNEPRQRHRHDGNSPVIL